jgi:hypothetical protein
LLISFLNENKAQFGTIVSFIFNKLYEHFSKAEDENGIEDRDFILKQFF